MNKSLIKVYMDDGRVFEYECDAVSAREHLSEILKTGYRFSHDGTLEWYPPSRIRKAKAVGGDVTEYETKVSGT